MTLPYIYQFTHSISFSLSALTHSISLPCKIDGKEGQSVNADFWHPVESISHQHRCSKFLMKSRIIWSNYDHNQQSKIQGYISLHVTEMNDLHFMHFTSFAFHAFHVISCCILHHFMSHFIYFIAHITCITRMSRTSRISHFANSAHFMHCTIHRVILCIISCHFIMKIHSILIHTI